MPTAPVSPELPRLRLRPAKAERHRGSGYARRKQSATAAPPGDSRAPGESTAK